jgi:inosine-uridine nucleoside N-ribohydrolase
MVRRPDRPEGWMTGFMTSAQSRGKATRPRHAALAVAVVLAGAPCIDDATAAPAQLVLSAGSQVTSTAAAVRLNPPDTALCSTTKGLFPAAGEPVRVILDTDFASDVDDVGALGVLHALADRGEVEILAVMVSNGGTAPAHRAIDSVNTYYGRPDIPIGVVSGTAPTLPSVYVNALASQFPNDIQSPAAAVDLYRQILAAQPNDAVTIVSVGYLTNLDALLSSPPDARSPLRGTELVRSKVRRWVAMGGHYPDSAAHPAGTEFNFEQDARATSDAIAAWPTPAIFSGFEVGTAVLTGAVLQQTPAANPVRAAYRLFNGGNNHPSWDLTAVLIAARGAAGVFDMCTGRNVIATNGRNTWQFDPGGAHGYVRLAAPAAQAAAVLDSLLAAPSSPR